MTKLLPAVLLLCAGASRAQQPITLTAATPKILGVTDYGVNDPVKLSAQATGPGTFNFSISWGQSQASGTVKIDPPASLTAVDNGSYLSYVGNAAFSGQGTWMTNDQFISVYWSSIFSLDKCDSNPFKTGAFPCQISSLSVENVGGQRMAYFDGYIFYYTSALDQSYYITARMYYQIGGGTSGQGVMEAVQVTQSFDTDKPSYSPLPLIAGKSTTIRMYPIQTNPPGPVGGKIQVSQGGNMLGTLTPLNSAAPQTSVVRGGNQNPPTSLDFKIPGAWTKNGDLTVTGTFLDVGSGPPLPPNPAPLTLHFQPQAKTPFVVRYMEWCAPTLTSPTKPVCPSDDKSKANDMADAGWFMRTAFPVADDGISYVPLLLPALGWTGQMADKSGLNAFINHLRMWYVMLGAAGIQEDQLVAWLPDDVSPVAIGDSDPISFDGYPKGTPQQTVGHVTFISDIGVYHTLAAANAEVSLAHEIGHNLGLRHPNTTDWGGIAGGGDANSCFPYSSAKIQNPGYADVLRAYIPDTATWDFMSYHSTLPEWLAPYTYDLLIRGGLQPQPDSINRNWDPTLKECTPIPTGNARRLVPNDTPEATAQKPPTAAAAAATDFIIISGTVSKDGSATLKPTYRVSSSAVADQSDPAGAYCINFNAGATILTSFCFNASFGDPEGGTFTTQSFAFVIPFPSQTTSIALLKQGLQVASVPVSKNAPVVSITSPKTGDTWNGGSQTISWTATDADGDPLTYAVLYSADGGNTYLPLSLALTVTQLIVDPSALMGGSQVYFRVMASDGINTTSATVGPITVNQTPKLTISAASFALGNANSSSVATGTVTLVSSGSGPLTINSASIDNGAFTITDPPLPLVIPAGRRASLTVQFTPASNVQGAQSGMITVVSNDPTGPLKVPVTGMAFTNPVANGVVTPQTLSFTAVAGQTQDRTIAVANTGAANLTVNSISISNASFTLVGVQTPLTVKPNTSQSITVRFTATNSGTQSGTATIATNDPTNPTSAVTLSGNVVTLPVLSVTKIHAGSFGVSQQGATYTVTVSNTGTAPTSGTVTVTDTVPTGLTLVSMAGNGWSCTANSCTRNDALLPSTSYPAITVTVNVAANAASPQMNAVSVSGGGSQNAYTTDSTTITSVGMLARLRDWAGNGRSGALLYVPSSGAAYTALSNGNGTYTYVGNAFTPGFDTLRSGDFNGDGKADMVLYNSGSPFAYIGFGNGDGTFNFQSLFWSLGYNFVEPGDLNGDGRTDFALYNSATGTVYTAISNSLGQFTYKYTLISTGYTYLKLRDFNGDGFADLFAYNSANGNATVGIGDGLGGFTFHSFQISPNYNLLDVGDLNADGKADIILYNAANGNGATGISDGAGGFSFTSFPFSPGFTAMRLAEFSGHPGKADVIVYNANTTQDYFGTGTGTGTFNFVSLFWSPGYNWVEPEDVNGDGKTDIILYNSATGTEYTGISNGDGTFTYTYQYWGIGRVLAR